MDSKREVRRGRPGRELPRVGKGSWITWVVVLYSSKVLARLSAWQVRWERPKLTETGPTHRHGGREGRVNLREGQGELAEGQHWVSRPCRVMHGRQGNPLASLGCLLIQGGEPGSTSLSRLRAGDGQVHGEANVPPPLPSPLTSERSASRWQMRRSHS